MVVRFLASTMKTKKTQPIQIIRDAYRTDFVTDSAVLAVLGGGYSGNSKLSRMVKAGELIRIKRGLFVISSKFDTRAPNLFHLANLVFGPSYVSLESALSFYGLIPEAVRQVTSVNIKRPKLFRTALGRFSYRSIPASAFAFEVQSVSQSGKSGNFLIASREKALLDKCYLDGPCKDLLLWLTESLRIELGTIVSLKKQQLKELSRLYHSETFRRAVLELVRDISSRERKSK